MLEVVNGKGNRKDAQSGHGMLLEDGKERAASGISFREDRGLLVGKSTHQSEYTRGET